MSLGLLHIFTDPARFGNIPDPPEPRECDPEDFDIDDCKYCSNEAGCRELWEKYGGEE